MSHTNGRHESGSSSNGLSGHTTGFTPPEGQPPPLSDFLMQLDDYTPTLPDRWKIKKASEFFLVLRPPSLVSLGIIWHHLVSTPQILVSCVWSPLLPKSLSQTWQAKHFNMHGFVGEESVLDQPGAEKEARRGMPSWPRKTSPLLLESRGSWSKSLLTFNSDLWSISYLW